MCINTHACKSMDMRRLPFQNISTKLWDSRGYGVMEEEKRGLCFTMWPLPQFLTQTHRHTHFSGSQWTFGASVQTGGGGTRVFRNTVRLGRKQEILKIPNVSIRFRRERGIKCIVFHVIYCGCGTEWYFFMTAPKYLGLTGEGFWKSVELSQNVVFCPFGQEGLAHWPFDPRLKRNQALRNVTWLFVRKEPLNLVAANKTKVNEFKSLIFMHNQWCFVIKA